MKIGVNLINFGPGAHPQALKSWAQLAEALGYHLIMTSDHIAVTPDVQSRNSCWAQPMPTPRMKRPALS